MTAREPGFGATPRWIALCISGGIWLIFGTIALVGGFREPAGILIVGCGLLGWGVINRVRGFGDDEQAAALPPTSQADLTARVLAWTKTSHRDLEVCRRGEIPPSRTKELQRLLHSTMPQGALSPLQSAEGPVQLSMSHLHTKTRYFVKINGVTFVELDEGLVLAFKRTARYRVYFVTVLYPSPYSRWSRTVLVSGEALGDA